MLQILNYCSAAYELAYGIPLYFAPNYFFGVEGIYPHAPETLLEEASNEIMNPVTETYFREVGCMMITLGLGQLLFLRQKQDKVDRNVLMAGMCNLIAFSSSIPIHYMALQEEEYFVKKPMVTVIAIKLFLGGLTGIAISSSCQDVSKQPITTPSRTLFWAFIFSGIYGVYYGLRFYINGPALEFFGPAMTQDQMDPLMMYASRILGAYCLPSFLNFYAAFRTSGVELNRFNCLFSILFFAQIFKNMYNTEYFARDVVNPFLVSHIAYTVLVFYAAQAFDVIVENQDQTTKSILKKKIPQSARTKVGGEDKAKSQ